MMYKLEEVPGDIAEFGVAAGISLISFARTIKILEIGKVGLDGRNIYGFDSFEGLPAPTERDNLGDELPDTPELRKGGYDHPKAYPSLLAFEEQESNVRLIKGWFNDTVPLFFRDNPHILLAFIHIDADLYESTKTALDHSWDRLVPGGIILFDELHHPGFPGETVAFREFFKDKTGQYSMHSTRAWPAKKYLKKL